MQRLLSYISAECQGAATLYVLYIMMTVYTIPTNFKGFILERTKKKEL
jgi:hypothetical protein